MGLSSPVSLAWTNPIRLRKNHARSTTNLFRWISGFRLLMTSILN